LLGVGANVLSRKYEFEADAFSAHTARLPIETFINALKRLSVNNLSNLSPHPLKVALEYTHPPVIERIIRLRMFAPQKQTDAK
jgi:STE24 endopeptidase